MIDKLILIGGFLGSGKTTLLAEAAKRLAGQGKAVGLVTNDQAPELVDTQLLTGVGSGVSELAGSCFCCNFNGFVDSIKSLTSKGATIVIAEPVGSCTDLTATMGMTDKAAVELSGEFSRMAIDIGSFMMVNPDSVMNAFQSALMGNTITSQQNYK